MRRDIEVQVRELRAADELAAALLQQAQEAQERYPAASEKAQTILKFDAMLRGLGGPWHPDNLRLARETADDITEVIATLEVTPEALAKVNAFRDALRAELAPKLAALPRIERERLLNL